MHTFLGALLFSLNPNEYKWLAGQTTKWENWEPKPWTAPDPTGYFVLGFHTHETKVL